MARGPASSRLCRASATGCGELGNDLVVMVVAPIVIKEGSQCALVGELASR